MNMETGKCEALTKCTIYFKKLEHKVGRNWLAKFSIPSPSFPCRPSPKVYKRPDSQNEKKRIMKVTLMDLFVNSKYINWHCNFPLIFCIEVTLVHWCLHTFYGCCPHITLGNRYRESITSTWWLVKLRPSPAGVVWSSSNPEWALMINTTFSKRVFVFWPSTSQFIFFFLRSLIRWGFINSGTTDIWGSIIPNCMGLSCALWNVQQYPWLLSIKCPYNTPPLQLWQSKISPTLPCVPWGNQNTTRLDQSSPLLLLPGLWKSWRKCHKPTMLLVEDTNIGGSPTAGPKIMMSNCHLTS